jgi:predicted NBD/HSP70 family sugar kinase
MIIEMDGRQCGCGQKGCIEAYASALNTASIFIFCFTSLKDLTITYSLIMSLYMNSSDG